VSEEDSNVADPRKGELKIGRVRKIQIILITYPSSVKVAYHSRLAPYLKLGLRPPIRVRYVFGPLRALVDGFRASLTFNMWLSGGLRLIIQTAIPRETLAVLFVDLEKSTRLKQVMMEQGIPEWWVSTTAGFHATGHDIIRVAGGDVSKYIGDEILAIFRPRHPCSKALRAAAAIADHLEMLNSQKRDSDIVDWIGFHISLDYGEAWMIHHNDPYSSVVDRAARIAKKAGENEILRSSDFLTQLNQDGSEGLNLEFVDVTTERGQLTEFPDSLIYKAQTA